MNRRSAPVRRTRPADGAAGAERGGLVEVRLIGREAPVRRFVEALEGAAGAVGSSPASFRPTRDGTGVRAYLTVALPDDEG